MKKTPIPEQSWPADAVSRVQTASLIPYARNARTHSDAQVAQIAASIREWGWTVPVLVDEQGTLIAGHGRLLAAQVLGLPDVPVMVAKGWGEAKRRAYAIADNRLALNAGWDEAMLALEVSALEADGFDLDLLGFDPEELDDLLNGTDEGTEGLTDPDDVPEPLPDAISKLGDVWLLGKHRLMCGDSTDGGSVTLLMNAEKAQLMQTDPPYGIAYVQNAQSKWQGIGHADIENDDLDGEKLQAFLESMIRAALPLLNDNCAFYLWHPMLTQGAFFAAAAAAAADILIHRQLIWCKPSLVFGRGDYHWQHELCFYGWVRGNRPPFYGQRNQTTLWNIGRETIKEHPTAKPVDLWRPPIDNHTKPGEICYEPFSGSGSQIISAEQTGRRCYAMELSPQYVDVAVRRWQNFTGETATLEATGEHFPA